MKRLLSGNEAIALGAYEGGTAVAAAYPGTPSTEILEHLAKYPGVYAEWTPNEKVALDVAVGAAYAGKRALAAMKHVGLNVAADSLFYASYTGVVGGLVIVTADDPGMYSSQNEQDNRNYAKFAKLPMLEPSDSQEARDFVKLAFALSEEFATPVLLRSTTRVAHSYSVVDVPQGEAALPLASTDKLPYPRDQARYVMIPGNARRRHPIVEERLVKLTEYAETFVGNRVEAGNRRLGIISGGIAYQYAREVFPEASFLKLGMSYPLPRRLIQDFAGQVEKVIVLEDLDPFWEEQVRLLGVACEGKRYFPMIGEFNPDVVRAGAVKAGLLPASEAAEPRDLGFQPTAFPLPGRPPVLCPGCGHRGVLYVLKKLKVVVNGDIGCYTLGVIPPLSAMDSSGCMGASIGVAHGVERAGAQERAVAVIGDSTFFHSGIAPLINVFYNQGTAATFILDNQITAMTGHQDHPGTGKTLQNVETVKVDLEKLVRGIGIEDVYVVDAYDLKAVEQAARVALAGKRPAVVIARRPCALMVKAKGPELVVNAERCNGCALCLRTGCPALIRVSEKLVRIDPLLCTGCAVCQQVCARGAILVAS